MIDDSQFRCRVCGLKQEQAPWNESGEASFRTCPCCGTKSGVDDVSFRDVISRRNHWVDAGACWLQPSAKPEHWELNEQLGKLADAWTLESQGIDPNKTVPNIEVDRIKPSAFRSDWKPEYLDFYHFVAMAGLTANFPNDQQIENFANYFVDRFSFLEFFHSNAPDNLEADDESGYVFGPSHQAEFFLNPYAGWAAGSWGTPTNLERTIQDEADGIWQIATDEYQAEYGLLDFTLVKGRSRWDQDGQTQACQTRTAMHCFLKHPTSLPVTFAAKGSFFFSNFLNCNPYILSKLSKEPGAKKNFSIKNIVRRLVGKAEPADIDSERYRLAIREINRNRDKQGKLNDHAMEVAHELQRYEKEKLRQTLLQMRDHYRALSATALDIFQAKQDANLHRIAADGISHFVAGEGFIFAYVPADRCAVLPDSDERTYLELDGEKVAGVLNVVEYEEVVRRENRKVRVQRDYREDEELLEDYFEQVFEEDEIQIFVRELYWSYKPEERLTLVATLPNDVRIETLYNTKRRFLKNEFYFSVCETCWRRKPRGIMMKSPDECSSCQEPDQSDDDEEIIH